MLFIVPIVLNKIDRNEAPSVNGSQAYDFIYVEDVILQLQNQM